MLNPAANAPLGSILSSRLRAATPAGKRLDAVSMPYKHSRNPGPSKSRAHARTDEVTQPTKGDASDTSPELSGLIGSGVRYSPFPKNVVVLYRRICLYAQNRFSQLA
jgi:hypothetical protein